MKKTVTRKQKVVLPGAVGEDKGYLEIGRVNQKLRTRDALVSIAADLVRNGQAISVADVADLARVSRTTAYRYFPTSEMLRAQAALYAAGDIETHHLDEIAQGPGSPEEKLDAIIVGSHKLTEAHEAAFRSVLHLSAESGIKVAHGLPRRPGFRRHWIEGALAEVKRDLGPKGFSRLTAALSLLCGIEAFVVLGDVCLMDSEEACRTKRWAGQQLLRAALAEAAERTSSAKSKVASKAAPRAAPHPKSDVRVKPAPRTAKRSG